jgi:hypothetical protein
MPGSFVDPTGGCVLVSDLGTDKIHSYAVTLEEAGRRRRLQEVSVYEAAVGAGPRHLCFHPDGRRVYSINELDCTIAALSYDPATAQLSGPLAVSGPPPPPPPPQQQQSEGGGGGEVPGLVVMWIHRWTIGGRGDGPYLS